MKTAGNAGFLNFCSKNQQKVKKMIPAAAEIRETDVKNGFCDRLAGIHAATIVPMRGDYSIDEQALADHLGTVLAVEGIRGLLINGHAGENVFLGLEEKRRVMQIAREVGPDALIVSGVNSESSLDAAAEAAAMQAAGADGLLVFPPNGWALGVDPEAVMIHHRMIAAATPLPLMLYGAPVTAGAWPYPPELLARLATEDRVVAIKEGSWEVARYEANLRLLHAQDPGFRVLGSGDEHLLTSYMIGSFGSQVSLAAVVPELTVALWNAAAAGDWAEARRVHEKIYPLSVAIYRDGPAGRANVRLKTCLHILGRLASPLARPPQFPATATEIARLTHALDHAFS